MADRARAGETQSAEAVLELFGQTLSLSSGFFLLLALALALGFEFVNGFHDTANAVATVIYTHTLRPTAAVVWSGCWNLFGVLTSSGAVAFGVLALLPVDLVLNVGSASGFAMVFAFLISAVLWNLGTWYLGLPASSSHTLVGSILGVGLANSMVSTSYRLGDGVNWTKAGELGMSLLISPLVGFTCAALLLLVGKALIRNPGLHESPAGRRPPLWIRVVLVTTCTGVSFAHGSNDGQKGMGLIMLILIGILPASFAVDLSASRESISELATGATTVAGRLERRSPVSATLDPQASNSELASYLRTSGTASPATLTAAAAKCREVAALLAGKASLNELGIDERRVLRHDLYLTSEVMAKLLKQKKFEEPRDAEAASLLKSQMDNLTKFIPALVKVAVAFTLGLGTMVGWKRIVVTVGEKIGKEQLTYAQGAVAELVTMSTILGADRLGLPVSTTHVLSSGVAGSMAASRSGLQMKTLRNLLLAWVLTLPVCVLLGAGIFAFALNVLLRFAS